VRRVHQDRAKARGASRPSSEFVDGPCLAARVEEVDEVDSFLPMLLFLLFQPKK